MANCEVHWHEGMFLRQHHFLTARRHANRVLRTNAKWDLHHNWGLRSIQFNQDALANFRFAVTALKARLRDGTVVEVPEDGTLPELDLKPAFAKNRQVTIYLALPVVRSGRANVAADAAAGEEPRFAPITQELEDENTGVNPQAVTVLVPNLKLLLSTQELSGYDAVPIARVEKSDRPEATPELDKTYFPPMLACDAWHDLQVGILQSVFDRVGRKIEKLAGQVVSRGLTLDSQAQGDPLIFAQLREMNEAYATLLNLAFVEGVHPFDAYQELCRFVGQLSIFGASRRPPPLLKYNHDDLGGCFYRVKRYLDDLVSIVPEPDYQERPFIGAGLRMQVALERPWLEATAQMFIGVQSGLRPEECARLMEPGALDMKVGSSERVETIFRMGDQGLKFAQATAPPQALPRSGNLTYFQIARDSQEFEWQAIERSLTLAIRLNEELVTGSIDRQQVLSLRFGNAETTLQFTLYVLQGQVRAAAGAPS